MEIFWLVWSGHPGPTGLPPHIWSPVPTAPSGSEKHWRQYFTKTVAHLRSQVKKIQLPFFNEFLWQAGMRCLSKYRHFLPWLNKMLTIFWTTDIDCLFSLVGMSFLIRRQEENKNQTVSHNQKPPLWQRGLHRHQGVPPDRERLQPSEASWGVPVWGCEGDQHRF